MHCEEIISVTCMYEDEEATILESVKDIHHSRSCARVLSVYATASFISYGFTQLLTTRHFYPSATLGMTDSHCRLHVAFPLSSQLNIHQCALVSFRSL